MSLFLSKEEQKITESICSIGLWYTSNEDMLNLITALYSKNRTEYYLFNKIKIWETK